MEPSRSDDPVSTFNELWRVFDERYAFFEIKGIDWDSVYQQYRPMINEQTRSQELFNICLSMLEVLQDGHIFLRGDANSPRYAFQPTFDPRTLNRESLKRVYLNNQAQRADGLLYRTFDKVGYIYYESFTENLSFVELEKVFSDFEFLGVNSIIVDVRGNGGGNPANALRLAERFTTVRRQVFQSKVKIGPRPEDFSDPEIHFIEPVGNYQFSGPVMILVDGQTFSAANFFVALMKSLPQVLLSGRPTGGGGGLPAVYELPNGWTFSYSASFISMPDGYVIERGFEPDLTPPVSSALTLLGRDPILEFSINYLKRNVP
jgi:C-terminal processing protease CtpA/Prc